MTRTWQFDRTVNCSAITATSGILDGELKVKVSNLNNELSLIISDNGKPFPIELNAGYGLQSTYDKLQLLYPNTYALQIINEPFNAFNIC
jgi:LytS/YehU family sensor histidine kinase